MFSPPSIHQKESKQKLCSRVDLGRSSGHMGWVGEKGGRKKVVQDEGDRSRKGHRRLHKRRGRRPVSRFPLLKGHEGNEKHPADWSKPEKSSRTGSGVPNVKGNAIRIWGDTKAVQTDTRKCCKGQYNVIGFES